MALQLTAYTILLTIAFAWPLWRLAQHALASDLHSHIVLVPLISWYLVRERRPSLPALGKSAGGAALFGLIGAGLATAALVVRSTVSINDHLALLAAAYVSLLCAGGFWLQGAAWMRAAAFPFAFLMFLVPLPDRLVYLLERGSVLASSEASAAYFWLAGTPLVRNGTIFELSTITLRVAQECSGIRSSWVLFISSVLAAQMFLKRPWHRVALVLFVIPLGILRNGFRVFVIGMLCVHVGPHMIDSAIHHRGGPIFFMLSLGPLLFFVWWLRRREVRQAPSVACPSDAVAEAE